MKSDSPFQAGISVLTSPEVSSLTLVATVASPALWEAAQWQQARPLHSHGHPGSTHVGIDCGIQLLQQHGSGWRKLLFLHTEAPMCLSEKGT